MANNKKSEDFPPGTEGLLSVLASPVRLQIIAVMQTLGGNMGLDSIVDGLSSYRKLSRSHVCEQLQVFEKTELILKKKMGKFTWYSIDREAVKRCAQAIRSLAGEVGGTRRRRLKGKRL